MCGICGELRFDGRAPDPAVIQVMTERLARRGPDGSGRYLSGPVALGHRRLAVIDLSARADQPMHDDAAGLVLVFNGTIYNYPELREELRAKGHNFVSSGDSEVILKAYAEWGEGCPTRLQGVFAFAIWDSAAGNCFLRATVSVSSRCITASHRTGSGLPRPARRCWRVAGSTPRSIRLDCTGILPCMPWCRHRVPCCADCASWRRPQPDAASGQAKDAASLLAAGCTCLPQRPERVGMDRGHPRGAEAAVERRRVIADVPVGILLSGGLDSSLLVALLAEAGCSDLVTFSVGFEDEPEEKGNEFEYSDLVAEMYDTRHHRIHIPNAEVLSRLPEAVDHMSEPMVGQDSVAFYLLGERVSQEVKVVQSGQGADEVFAGYFWYRQMQAEHGADVERFRHLYFDRSHDELQMTVTGRYHGPDYTTPMLAHGLAASHHRRFLNRVLAFDVTTLIVDDPVKRVDNMTMAWGLEARVPFLDQELVELVACMPPEIKLKSGGKHPLKAIARDLLPDMVIDRPKGYFPVPSLKYVRGSTLAFMRDVLDSRACRERGLFQRTYVEALLNSPEQAHTPLLGSKLWHLALLEFWLQRNVDISPDG